MAPLLALFALWAFVGIIGIILVCRAVFRRNATDRSRFVDGIVGTCAIALNICAVAVAVPIFRGAAVRGPRAQCISNINQIGKGLLMYAADNDETIPLKASWCDAVSDYVVWNGAFKCPSLKDLPYAFWLSERWSGKSTAKVDEATSTVLCFDAAGGKNLAGALVDVRYRHLDRTTISFLDGHTRVITKETAPQLRWSFP